MIRTIKGTILSLEPGGVVIDVSGWGVFVYLATAEPLLIGNKITLATYLAIKKDGPELYGFIDPNDRVFFELSLKVPGLGPKTALSILKRAPREQLESAITARDVNYLTRVVGLGKKLAGKIVIELAEKITPNDTVRDDADADVFDMLIALGYTDREARQALNAISPEVSGRDERFRAALSANLR